MPTRGSSRATDRALFWNGLCVALIAAAVGTAFIDAIPLKATLVLCALGLVAGVIGVPLYIGQLFAGRRPPRPAADVERSEPVPVTVEQESRSRCSCHGLPVRD